uniref:Spike protein n=1 Tax=Miniopterus bat coronavirus/Kenya/KY33/2006 TaxID=983928 RepID=F1DB14_9ALPC|nr:spike protein [Miniopterus bat coronavirus/Kenya/KY33/2006]
MFFLFVVALIPLVRSQANDCTYSNVADLNNMKQLKLGLPANVTNAYVSGYLPTPSRWYCVPKFNAVHKNAHGVFVSYHSTGQDIVVGVGTSKSNSSWGMYFHQKNGDHRAKIRICRWDRYYPVRYANSELNGRDCLYNKDIEFTFAHAALEIVGATWAGDKVVLYTRSGITSLFVPGATLWDVVAISCKNKEACAHQVINSSITAIVSTDSAGLISNYTVCSNCSGFVDHVFAVETGGTIPASFSFDNWFYLTNSSSPVSGRFVSAQPLLLACLWPIPGLLGNSLPIYYNMSLNVNASCNGFKSEGVADALRFALNFSDEASFARRGVIILETEGGNSFNFTCTNSSVVKREVGYLPFGIVDEPYYCYMTYFVNITAQTKTSMFVGMLPPKVREFVVMRNGDFYLNGFRIFSVGTIKSARFNISTVDGRDFWTVAFASTVDVMVDINSTNIQRLLYCDNPLNQVKCQQLRFNLDDGFYSYAPELSGELPRTIVRLPKYMTHSYINISVGVSYDTVNRTDVALVGWQVSFSDDWLNILSDNRTSVCVESSSYTVKLYKGSFSATNVKVAIEAGDCPFNLRGLNNYLTFGSLCFSLVPNGGCGMSIITQGSYGEPQKFAVLYVSYTNGDNVVGVPEGKAPQPGVLDMSEVHYNVCTSYTIYGHTGRGVISEAPVDYITGLFYTSPAGDLLAYKNATTGKVYSIHPCQYASQVAVVSDNIVGIASSTENNTLGFNGTIDAGVFFYHFVNYTDENHTLCEVPSLTYGGLGICADGKLVNATRTVAATEPVSPVITGYISVPTNFTFSVQAEYIQIMMKPVSVDCSVYVCNGNPRCLQLLTQYASACRTIEQALQLSARLESVEVNSMVAISEQALALGVISNFNNTFNMSAVVPPNVGGRSAIEDLLFDKVVTSGLGTVDTDYKECAAKMLNTIAEAGCVQYYNGIMVLPGVVDPSLLGQYTAALTGGMVLGGITAGAAIPFSIAVQSRINYLALQTDVLQRNQQILAESFNAAMGNITTAFHGVNEAIQQTSQALSTVAQALNKVQSVVNEQGTALSQLTKQLASNFQAISSSIEDLYNRLGAVEADQQVDRLITGRLAALNAFVAQQLTRYTEVKASRQLAQEKVNECVKSQSFRYGFCGNGTHVFSVANAAPEGIMFLHTVLQPTAFVNVSAFAGLCVDGSRAYVLKEPGEVLFKKPEGGQYLISPRRMFEPRVPQASDFVQIVNCSVSYVNISSQNLSEIIPDYIDVNKTLEDFLQQLPNHTTPDLNLDIYNSTVLNLTQEVNDLTARAENLSAIAAELTLTIANINETLVNLEWLNRVETYIKWPWYVWLAIVVALIVLVGLMLWCCLATGCCGCCSCLANSCGDCGGKRLQRYEIEKVHIQ